MAHVDEMIKRLPQLYRDGKLIKDVLELPALQLEILDEDAREVQRSHWFDTALELQEAARLAALLDIVPEPWQGLAEFRVWVHALRNARLRDGAVTKQALQNFVAEYTRRYQAVVGVQAVPAITSWRETLSILLEQPDAPVNGPEPIDLIRAVHADGPAFIDNPPKRVYKRLPALGGIEPLHQFSIVQRGLDETVAGFLLVGLPAAPESVPVIVNVTTGQALIFLGNIPPGARLWIRPDAAGGVQANLEGQDVTGKLRSVSGIVPGVPWSNQQVQQPAQALTLQRGKNDLWFLPVAHFESPGLDRFLLAFADLILRQGRYDETQFDQALFYQEPATVLRMTWIETQPATYTAHLPAGALLSQPGELTSALEARDRLQFSLNQAVQQLTAAGVSGGVEMEPFREFQGQMDFITGVVPMTHRERGPTGADRLPEAGGVFAVTSFDDSTFR